MMDIELLKELKDYIEERESKIDWEFGSCREIEVIISDGDMPDIYNKILLLIKECENNGMA